MVNLSKARSQRFWGIWEDSGAVSDITGFRLTKNGEGYPVAPKADQIRQALFLKLKSNKLDTRISFTTAALKEMYRISNGNWQHARIYAGTAILDALQTGKNVIHYQDIRNVNIAEPIALMLGGRDVWDQIASIGTRVPDMLPEGVQLGRMLALWDANKTRDGRDALETGRLPQYLDRNGIVYHANGIMGPEVILPFKYRPSHDEVGGIAKNLANFVQAETKKPQQIRDITNGSGALEYVQFFVQDQCKDEGVPKYSHANYRVAKEFGNRVCVSRETLCDESHPQNLLELYSVSLKKSN